ncbi:MAG: hypothetical protein HY765_02880, partial [Rhodomicrobium sp.]|nr:hypothetical protein [Rhodomicrobium sp.]
AQFFTTPYFSEGVVYSLPMIALGAYFVLSARPAPARAEADAKASTVEA